MNPEKDYPLLSEVMPDLEGFLDIGPDCEEQSYTLSGEEVTHNGDAE